MEETRYEVYEADGAFLVEEKSLEDALRYVGPGGEVREVEHSEGCGWPNDPACIDSQYPSRVWVADADGELIRDARV